MRKLIIAAMFAVSALTAGASMAQDKPAFTPEQQAEYAATAQTARSLSSYGEAKGDALALVTAAKMIAGLPGDIRAAEGSTGAALDVETILKKAEELAPGDEIITKIAGDVRAAAAANPKGCYILEVCNYYYCNYYLVC
jgi:hypothetical protein